MCVCVCFRCNSYLLNIDSCIIIVVLVVSRMYMTFIFWSETAQWNYLMLITSNTWQVVQLQTEMGIPVAGV